MPGYEVLLLRHDETFGYEGDLGLTSLGEQQARDRGTALAAELAAGTTVAMPHARTVRGVATAVTLRAAVVAALGPGEDVVVPLSPEPWFDNLRHSLHGRGVDTSVAVTERLALQGELPDWAREYDRFDSDHRSVAAASGPIDYWLQTRRCSSSRRTWPRTGSGAGSRRWASTAPPTCSSSP